MLYHVRDSGAGSMDKAIKEYGHIADETPEIPGCRGLWIGTALLDNIVKPAGKKRMQDNPIVRAEGKQYGLGPIC